MTIRVLVADDQAMVRAGLRMLLAEESDIDVVAEAGNGLEAVARASRFRPQVVLMDIRMPNMDGLEATRRILADDAAVRVLILTTFNLDDYVYEALRAGASGFVLKDDPPEQLIAAARTIAMGDALLSPPVTRNVIRHFTRLHRQPPPAAVSTLTTREMDVFRLIARGLSNAEIGRESLISDTTVKTHVTRVLQKAGGSRPRPSDRHGLSERPLRRRRNPATRDARVVGPGSTRKERDSTTTRAQSVEQVIRPGIRTPRQCIRVDSPEP